MLKVSDIKFQNCCYPPSASYLRDEVVSSIEGHVDSQCSPEEASRWKKLAKFMSKSIPEKQWLLGILGTI